ITTTTWPKKNCQKACFWRMTACGLASPDVRPSTSFMTGNPRVRMLSVALAMLTSAVETLLSAPAPAPVLGAAVIVVYNSRVPESKEVAEYYARRRHVPDEQVFGFALATGEAMTRREYLEQLQQPLLRQLEKSKLLLFSPATNRFPDFKPAEPSFRRVVE